MQVRAVACEVRSTAANVIEHGDLHDDSAPSVETKVLPNYLKPLSEPTSDNVQVRAVTSGTGEPTSGSRHERHPSTTQGTEHAGEQGERVRTRHDETSTEVQGETAKDNARQRVTGAGVDRMLQNMPIDRDPNRAPIPCGHPLPGSLAGIPVVTILLY
jgi:hypothetical protein